MTPRPRAPRALAAVSFVALLFAPAGSPRAQPAPAPARPGVEAEAPARGRGDTPREGASRPAAPDAARPEARRTPAPVTTSHALELPGRTLRFRVTVAAHALANDEGVAQAEVVTTAYQLDGADAATRPVTFAFNGGPGSASAWLHLGLLGPWRLPMDVGGVAPSAAAAVVPNAETWLDFTDLVMVDPVGTGHAQLLVNTDETRRRYWSVGGDAESLAEAARLWLAANGRLASPKALLGESYAGLRVPKMLGPLRSSGVGIGAVVLVSPVLDFAARSRSRHDPLAWVQSLPSRVAAARAARDPAAVARPLDAEAYAAGDYLTDLARGEADAAAVERVSARVAALTGLDPALVRRLRGRVDTGTFLRELDRGRERVASPYDASITGLDPEPDAAVSRPEDPFTGALTAPLAGAVTDLLARRFEWRVERPYRLANGQANGAWDWGRGLSRPEALSDLRAALALDPRLRVLVAHGLYDQVTPYFESKLLLDQVPALGGRERLRLELLPGGHMFYSRDDARAAFREMGRGMIEGLGQRP